MKHLYWPLIILLMGGMTVANRSVNPVHSVVDLGQPSTVQGLKTVGAILTSFDERGRLLTLKIAEIQLDSQDVSHDIYLYTVLYQQENGQWQPLCQPDSQGVIKAIPLAGRWNSQGKHINDDSITFACTNGALAKCVRWGYKPWKTIQGQSLRSYHQACTRMVRADYCGNGTGHTKNGTPIDVYDRLNIQQRTQKSGMAFEAAWNSYGAVRLNRARFSGVISQLKKECPKKLAQMQFIQSLKSIEMTPKLVISNALVFNDSFKNTEIIEK